MKVRVLHIIASLETGGAETALARICQATGSLGLDHHVLVMDSTGLLGADLQSAGIPVLAPRVHPLDMAHLLRLCTDWIPHVVQGWMYHGNLAASVVRTVLFPRAYLAWNIRCGLDTPGQYRPSTRALIQLLARCSGTPDLILYNAHSARAGHEAVGYVGRRGEVIPNGFDLEAFRPDPASRQALRSALGLREGASLVGLVARFHPEKNPQLFLEALSRLPPEVHGLMAGSCMVPENPALVACIQAFGLSARIHLLGERRDMPDVMAGLDLAVSASWNEGFSNALGEAQACGVPCVATAVGDSPKMIGGLGQLVPAGDAPAMAEAMSAILHLPAAEREALGLRCRQRMAEDYSLPAVARRYSKAYHRLADRL
ncbi:MAG: glycosyltransferase [Geothrix sp.]|nr:glycosyltransferase [Geothrix sp.]